MPLTRKGRKVRRAMVKFYGKERGKRVFYASERAGILDGVVKEKKSERKK